MDTNRNDLSMPSGLEVESANLHAPGCSCSLHSLPVESSPAWRDKLNSVKSEVSAKASELRGQFMEKKSELMTTASRRSSELRTKASERASAMRTTASERANHLRTTTTERVNAMRTRVDSELRSNTAKWAGIAAGAGVGIGLLARLMRHRMHARREMPEIIIVTGTC